MKWAQGLVGKTEGSAPWASQTTLLNTWLIVPPITVMTTMAATATNATTKETATMPWPRLRP